jgi:hypothetical protein
MSTVLLPFLQDVVFPWLQEKIPEALQTLANFWENTLLPAMEVIWKFVTEKMMPIWEALAEFFSVAFTLALTALTGIWQNVLMPVMEDIADFVSNTLGPVFEWMKDSVIDPTSEAFDGLARQIQSVANWVSSLTERLRGVELPDWMTPGSPTPWEIGLKGVADAMNQLNTVQLPQMARSLAVVGAGGATTNNFILNSTPQPGQNVEGEFRTMASSAGGI